MLVTTFMSHCVRTLNLRGETLPTSTGRRHAHVTCVYCEWMSIMSPDLRYNVHVHALFFEHLFLMTWQLVSLGKGYRDFPLHMGTENIFHITGTTGNRAVHTLALTVTLISTLDQSKVSYVSH